jgi:hypothetical protein
MNLQQERIDAHCQSLKLEGPMLCYRVLAGDAAIDLPKFFTRRGVSRQAACRGRLRATCRLACVHKRHVWPTLIAWPSRLRKMRIRR